MATTLTFRRARATKNYSVYELQGAVGFGKLYLPLTETRDELVLTIPAAK